MKHFILTAFWVIRALSSFGQTDTNPFNGSSNSNYNSVEIMPQFKGGKQAIYKFIADSMVYPKLASKDRIGGKVITQFTVDTLGKVVDIKVVKGIRDDINNEAIRLIGLLNDWTPGTQNGKKVRVVFTLPLYFYPDNKFKRKYKKEHNLRYYK